MKQEIEAVTDRREAIRTCMRYLAAAGLTGVSAGLVVRTLRAAPEDRCQLACRQCAILAGCRLPEAEQARRREKGTV